MIAGVAGGIGERLGIDPTLVRIAFVLSVFFGGFGAFAYLILWVLLPGASSASGSSAIGIAEERYARGEISADELQQIRADLAGDR